MKCKCPNGHKWYDDAKYGGNITCPVCNCNRLPPQVDRWAKENVEHLKPVIMFSRETVKSDKVR